MVGNNERRLGLANGDQVAEMTVVGLDIGLTGCHALTLELEQAHVESDLTPLTQLVGAPRILKHEDTDDTNHPGGPHRLHKVIHRQVGLLIALGVVRLVAHTLAALIGPLAVGKL